MIFIAGILIFSSVTLYSFVEQKLEQWVELRLLNWADNLLIDIQQAQDRFKANPSNFIFSSTGNEFTSSGILVQFMDTGGKILAKSPSLKRSSLPFAVNEDDILKDVEMSDGTNLKTYQRSIEFDDRKLGYLVVGIPTSQFHNAVNSLRVILAIVMTCTIIIMAFGINGIMSYESIRNQRKFLSFASHELRTPISVISGHAEVSLRGSSLSPECRETLTTIKEEADGLNSLVSDLLLIFRTQSGVQKIKKQYFNLSELLADCTSAVKKRYPRKNITLNLPQDSQIKADEAQMKKLINNLLENAAKFTAENGVVWIDLESKPSGFVLKVKDNGIGIKKVLQKNIFNAFYQVEQGKSGGVGLGLAIAKWVVDAHKGRIQILSEEGKGTQFTVSIPKA
jgi:signal transduction histidine kinase